MAKSFFERLTGSIRISEDEPESIHETKAPASPLAKSPKGPSLGFSRKKNAGPEEKSAVLHPLAADEGVETEIAEKETLEEGQLTVDIYDDGSNIVIQSTVAGVKPEDIDISLQEETLTIRGSRARQKEVNEDNFYYRELYWGTFSRSIILPEEVEFQKADAVIKNGLLTIKLPKKDKGEKKITVKAG